MGPPLQNYAYSPIEPPGAKNTIVYEIAFIFKRFFCRLQSVEKKKGSLVLLTNKPAACSTGQVSPVTEKLVSIILLTGLLNSGRIWRDREMN